MTRHCTSALQVAFLAGAQFVIEDDQVGLVCGHLGRNLLDLALAGIGGRIRAVPTPVHHGTDLGTRRSGQETNFFELFGNLFPTEVELDNDRPLLDRRPLSHVRPPAGSRKEKWMRGKGKAAKGRHTSVSLSSLAIGVLREGDRARRNDRRNRMLVHHLGDGVLEQNDILIEGVDLPLQLDAVHEVDGNRHALAPQGIEKRVL
jgi:hypothetical protein